MYVHVLFLSLSLSQFTVLHHSRVIGSSFLPHLSYVILPLLSKPRLPLPSLVATARQEAVAKRLLVTPTLCYCFMELYKSEGKRLLIFFPTFFICSLHMYFSYLLSPFTFFSFPFPLIPPSLPPSLPSSLVASLGPVTLKELAGTSLILRDLFVVLHLETHLKGRVVSDSRPHPFEWTALADVRLGN